MTLRRIKLTSLLIVCGLCLLPLGVAAMAEPSGTEDMADGSTIYSKDSLSKDPPLPDWVVACLVIVGIVVAMGYISTCVAVGVF